jgi:hypothetical protein
LAESREILDFAAFRLKFARFSVKNEVPLPAT